MASRCLAWLVSLLICQEVISLQTTRSGYAVKTKNGPTGEKFVRAQWAAPTNVVPSRVRLNAQSVEETPPEDSNVFGTADDAATEGVFGAAALVAGNMVGGGILAIPTVCAGPGFYPAAALTICLWAANVGTGLLLGEVAAAAVRRGDEDVSLRALSRDALGESGAQLTSAFFVVTNCVEINQCVGCASSRRRVDGVEDDANAP